MHTLNSKIQLLLLFLLYVSSVKTLGVITQQYSNPEASCLVKDYFPENGLVFATSYRNVTTWYFFQPCHVGSPTKGLTVEINGTQYPVPQECQPGFLIPYRYNEASDSLICADPTSSLNTEVKMVKSQMVGYPAWRRPLPGWSYFSDPHSFPPTLEKRATGFKNFYANGSNTVQLSILCDLDTPDLTFVSVQQTDELHVITLSSATVCSTVSYLPPSILKKNSSSPVLSSNPCPFIHVQHIGNLSYDHVPFPHSHPIYHYTWSFDFCSPSRSSYPAPGPAPQQIIMPSPSSQSQPSGRGCFFMGMSPLRTGTMCFDHQETPWQLYGSKSPLVAGAWNYTWNAEFSDPHYGTHMRVDVHCDSTVKNISILHKVKVRNSNNQERDNSNRMLMVIRSPECPPLPTVTKYELGVVAAQKQYDEEKSKKTNDSGIQQEHHNTAFWGDFHMNAAVAKSYWQGHPMDSSQELELEYHDGDHVDDRESSVKKNNFTETDWVRYRSAYTTVLDYSDLAKAQRQVSNLNISCEVKCNYGGGTCAMKHLRSVLVQRVQSFNGQPLVHIHEQYPTRGMMEDSLFVLTNLTVCTFVDANPTAKQTQTLNCPLIPLDFNNETEHDESFMLKLGWYERNINFVSPSLKAKCTSTVIQPTCDSLGLRHFALHLAGITDYRATAIPPVGLVSTFHPDHHDGVFVLILWSTNVDEEIYLWLSETDTSEYGNQFPGKVVVLTSCDEMVFHLWRHLHGEGPQGYPWRVRDKPHVGLRVSALGGLQTELFMRPFDYDTAIAWSMAKFSNRFYAGDALTQQWDSPWKGSTFKPALTNFSKRDLVWCAHLGPESELFFSLSNPLEYGILVAASPMLLDHSRNTMEEIFISNSTTPLMIRSNVTSNQQIEVSFQKIVPSSLGLDEWHFLHIDADLLQLYQKQKNLIVDLTPTQCNPCSVHLLQVGRRDHSSVNEGCQDGDLNFILGANYFVSVSTFENKALCQYPPCLVLQVHDGESEQVYLVPPNETFSNQLRQFFGPPQLLITYFIHQLKIAHRLAGNYPHYLSTLPWGPPWSKRVIKKPSPFLFIAVLGSLEDAHYLQTPVSRTELDLAHATNDGESCFLMWKFSRESLELGVACVESRGRYDQNQTSKNRTVIARANVVIGLSDLILAAWKNNNQRADSSTYELAYNRHFFDQYNDGLNATRRNASSDVEQGDDQSPLENFSLSPRKRARFTVFKNGSLSFNLDGTPEVASWNTPKCLIRSVDDSSPLVPEEDKTRFVVLPCYFNSSLCDLDENVFAFPVCTFHETPAPPTPPVVVRQASPSWYTPGIIAGICIAALTLLAFLTISLRRLFGSGKRNRERDSLLPTTGGIDRAIGVDGDPTESTRPSRTGYTSINTFFAFENPKEQSGKGSSSAPSLVRTETVDEVM